MFAKKKKAPGSDLLTSQLLRELPHKTLLQLTAIYNTILEIRYFSAAWKKANIIMICKPDKPKDTPSSYRPISLLPVLGKPFKKLLLQRLQPILDENCLIPPFQFGFPRKHSTVDQALAVLQKASAALHRIANTAAWSSWMLHRLLIRV